MFVIVSLCRAFSIDKQCNESRNYGAMPFARRHLQLCRLDLLQWCRRGERKRKTKDSKYLTLFSSFDMKIRDKECRYKMKMKMKKKNEIRGHGKKQKVSVVGIDFCFVCCSKTYR